MPSTPYGPNNPHPLSQLRTELVWEGKYDEYGNRREVDAAALAMPLQKIETVDEPASRAMVQGKLFEPQKAHRDDWRNMLVWGDNKLVMASLLKEYKGKIDLIYIDPPFDVGADFTLDVPIGENGTVGKDQSALEMVAYRDMWGRGTDSYVHMIYERLCLAKELLNENGTIYVHCDWRVNYLLRNLLDDVFGSDYFINQISWKRSANTSSIGKIWKRAHDTILFYSKSDDYTFNFQRKELSDTSLEIYSLEDENGKYRIVPILVSGKRNGKTGQPWRGIDPNKRGRNGMHWVTIPEKLDEYDRQGLIVFPAKEDGAPGLKYYLKDNPGVVVSDLWDDINLITATSSESLNYATQKPEELLERIISASSNEGDIVADFFCGSGTTGAVAERLGRRWIMSDLGRFAIHTSRKRLIELQRNLHSEQQAYRSFDVYNLGRYERQWWQKERLKGADEEHRKVVLEFYRAESLPNSPSPLIHGRKAGAFVHVDKIDSIFTRQEVREVALAVKQAGGKEVNCLAWEFEMDLRIACNALESEMGIKIKLIPIPREIMEKNRKEPPPFLEVATLEAAAVYGNVAASLVLSDSEGASEAVSSKRGKAAKQEIASGSALATTSRTVDIKLTKFLPSLAEVPSKELEALKERAVKSGFDFIDFWAIDFDWHPDQPFSHHWQAYRTRKDRSLPTVSDLHYQYEKKGKHTVCVKVVDVFGVDTSITLNVEV